MFKYERRWSYICQVLEQERYDVFLSKIQGNVRYLCCSHLSFYPPVEYVLIFRNGDSLAIVSSLECERARHETAVNGVKVYSPHPGINADEKNARVLLKKILNERKVKNVFTDCKMKISGIGMKYRDIVGKMRMKKDDMEIKNIKKACKIADYGVDKLINEIFDENKTEKKVATELDYILREKGANCMSFNTIIASGKHTFYPHHEPTSRKLGNGFVICDFGVYVDGYCSDITRTLPVGNVSEKMIDIYNIVFEAQTKTIRGINQCKSFSEIDNICRGIIKEYGLDKYFVHSTGHGIGLEVHELPSISSTSKHLIEKGNVFTIEPGIYIPNRFGVRIEDDIYVDNTNNVVILTKAKKKL